MFRGDRAPASPERSAHRRHYLMVMPTFFDVTYSINPWMDPTRPTYADVGVSQWKGLHDLFIAMGHEVELLDPVPGLPDMVFAANGATTKDGRVLVARFRHDERAREAASYLSWFAARGWDEVAVAEYVNEGEGDFLVAGDVVLGASGFRSDPRAHHEVADFFGCEVVALELVDPSFYHLDTALTVLDDDNVAYFPEAFSPASRAVLVERYPDAVLADRADALAFGLNAVSDGRTIVLPRAATGLAEGLRERGYVPVPVELDELLKAGGSAKCCTLELRGAPRAHGRRAA